LAEKGDWKFGFWIMTGFTITIFSACIMGYFSLSATIVSAEVRLREEKNEDLVKLESKFEHFSYKIEAKVEKVSDQVAVMRKENNTKFTDILLVLEQIKAKQ